MGSGAPKQNALHALYTEKPEILQSPDPFDSIGYAYDLEPTGQFHQFADSGGMPRLFDADHQTFVELEVVGPEIADQLQGVGVGADVVERKSETVAAEIIEDQVQVRRVGHTVELPNLKDDVFPAEARFGQRRQSGSHADLKVVSRGRHEIDEVFSEAGWILGGRPRGRKHRQIARVGIEGLIPNPSRVEDVGVALQMAGDQADQTLVRENAAAPFRLATGVHDGLEPDFEAAPRKSFGEPFGVPRKPAGTLGGRKEVNTALPAILAGRAISARHIH